MPWGKDGGLLSEVAGASGPLLLLLPVGASRILARMAGRVAGPARPDRDGRAPDPDVRIMYMLVRVVRSMAPKLVNWSDTMGIKLIKIKTRQNDLTPELPIQPLGVPPYIPVTDRLNAAIPRPAIPLMSRC